ncbi:MAG: hypothetical protein ACYDEV_05055 [Acidiferrobacter sp.]
MRIERTDPVTGHTIVQPDKHPYVVEGEDGDTLKIFFESEDTRQEYLSVATEHPEKDQSQTLDNPAPLPGDEPNGLPQQQG